MVPLTSAGNLNGRTEEEKQSKRYIKKIKAEWRNWKKYGEGMRKTKNEKLKNFVYIRSQKASPWIRSTALWLFWLSYIVATRWYFFFFARSKNEKLFFCAEFFFPFWFSPQLYCQWWSWWWWLLYTFRHSHWGTSVSKHMEEFLFSRTINENFLHMGIV